MKFIEYVPKKWAENDKKIKSAVGQEKEYLKGFNDGILWVLEAILLTHGGRVKNDSCKIPRN